MPDVADPTLGAKYQADLAEAAKDIYREYLDFYLKVAMQDGYLPGTEPLKGDEKVAAAYETVLQLQQKGQMEGLTPREQEALTGALDTLEQADAEQAT